MVFEHLTIIVTSCDRFDLLEKTLDSFFRLNNYPYEKMIINNDSLNPLPPRIYEKYKDFNVEFYYGVKRGLSASFDFLVSKVQTEYFFNIEDDWLFSGNPDFIENSIDILKYSNFDQVWIRHHKDFQHPISEKIEYINGISFRRVELNGDWCGFSFNPAVRELSRWKSMFPNGVSGVDEIDISRRVYNFYSACVLEHTSIGHIGYNRHSKNFQI
jgi:hypothetical protein